METKANYIATGFFTLLAIAIAAAFIYWESTSGSAYNSAKVTIRIPGSAAGLAQGSPITFNGVRVGDITGLSLDPDNPGIAIASAVIKRDTPLKPSTTAKISTSGLAGSAGIELAGGNASEPNVIAEHEKSGEPIVLTAEPSSLANLLQLAEKLLTRADTALTAIEGFVNDVREPLSDTIGNFRKASSDFASLSERLGQRGGDIEEIVVNTRDLTARLSESSTKLDGILGKADKVMSDVQGVFQSPDGTSVMDEARATFKSFREVAETLNSKLGPITAGLQRFTTTGLPDVQAFVRDGRRSLNRIEEAVSGFERNPQRVITGGAGQTRTYDGRQRR